MAAVQTLDIQWPLTIWGQDKCVLARPRSSCGRQGSWLKSEVQMGARRRTAVEAAGVKEVGIWVGSIVHI